jgi:tRNA(Ile)-lysidine synthase TilS/MesJ
MDEAGASNAIHLLKTLFPDADPEFLAVAVQHHITTSASPGDNSRKGKERQQELSIEEIVNRVSHKLVELNCGEYPRIAFRRGVREMGVRGGEAARENVKGTGIIREMKQVKSTWIVARGRSTSGSASIVAEPPACQFEDEVDETLARNQAL